MVFEKNSDNTISTYDGKTKRKMLDKEYVREKFNYKSQFIWIPTNDHDKKKCTLEEYYNNFVKDADELKQKSRG